MRKLKIFGVAFAAAMALSALAAAAAFATYDSEAPVTTLKGSQVAANVFTTNAGTVKCEVAEFEGTQTGSETAPGSGIFTAAEIEVHPKYSKCRAFGLAATVNTEGCNYKFTTAVKNAEGIPQGKVHVVCATGKEIVVNAGFGSCVSKIGSHTPGGVVDFENQGTGSSRDVLVNATVTGIKYSQEGPTCTGGTGTCENGTYVGSVTVKGFSASTGLQVGTWVT
jgi:hypothetical protein